MPRIPEMPVPPPIPWAANVVTIRPRRTLPRRRRSKWPWLLLVLLCLLVLPVFRVAISTPDPRGSQTEAIIYAQGFVENCLRAPATAQFPWETMAILDGDVWRVSGSVDSQNGFGALIRSDWQCELRKSSDGWRCRSLVIEGKRLI